MIHGHSLFGPTLYDTANRLVYTNDGSGRTTFTFDANGNQTRQLTPAGARTTSVWDFENMNTSVQLPNGTRVTYTYTAERKRMKRQSATQNRTYVYDGNNLFAEIDASFVVQVIYALEPLEHGRLISQRIKGAGADLPASYHHYDAQGSTSALTGPTAVQTDSYIYTAFGETKSSSGTTTNLFTWVGELGYIKEVETGEHQAGERPIQPLLARWKSEDPLGPTTDSRLNPFGYVENNPVNEVDPSGLLPEPKPPAGGSGAPVPIVCRITTQHFDEAVLKRVSKARTRQMGAPLWAIIYSLGFEPTDESITTLIKMIPDDPSFDDVVEAIEQMKLGKRFQNAINPVGPPPAEVLFAFLGMAKSVYGACARANPDGSIEFFDCETEETITIDGAPPPKPPGHSAIYPEPGSPEANQAEFREMWKNPWGRGVIAWRLAENFIIVCAAACPAKPPPWVQRRPSIRREGGRPGKPAGPGGGPGKPGKPGGPGGTPNPNPTPLPPVLFGQKRIGIRFGIEDRPPHLAGRLVSDVAADLRAGKLSADQLPIDAFRLPDGRLVAVNNRSLAALSEAGMKPTKVNEVPATRELLLRLSETPLLPNAPLPGDRVPVTESQSDLRIIRVDVLP